uniref:prostaglandin-endoperoxide synthase n=1 Tax=Tubulanus polymorphus TaxID=672921 RepID=A0A0U2LJA6_9BILA|nr:cyclooxygenase [Tubulanus polymorphus]
MDATILTKLVFIATCLCIGAKAGKFNPCCSNPCDKGSLCMTKGLDDYVCDCTGLEFYGRNCDIPTWRHWLVSFVKPTPETLHNFLTHNNWFWNLVNGFQWLHSALLKMVLIDRAAKVDIPNPFAAEHDYSTVDGYFNLSTYGRALPPIPRNCPKPMGTKGKAELPHVDVMVERLFARREFIPDSLNTNVFFGFFAQHFTHMFFKTEPKKGPAYTWGRHGVDVSNVYGPTRKIENALRSMKGGKLKMQTINGEDWPMYSSSIPDIEMMQWTGVNSSNDFALGHNFFSILPGLEMISTIWMREHNRVAGILEKEHPEWDDEQLFQTSKIIILAETIKIVIEDYVQHLSAYKFRLDYDPALLHGAAVQYQNRIYLEFNHLYRWHPLMPDTFKINGEDYSMLEFMNKGTDVLINSGLANFLKSLIAQQAGQIGPRNHNLYTQHVVKTVVHESRELRIKPFNEYRKKYNLVPYKSFEELTGEKEIAGILEDMYGDVDAVEYYVGIMLERSRKRTLFGSTVVDVGGPFSLQGLYANPIGSPKYWCPTTFGGEVGFNIAKTASLEKLFCKNIKGECPRVTFTVQATDATGKYVKDEL